MNEAAGIQGAEAVLPCERLDETLAFFTDRLGFRVSAIFPADHPRVAVVAGHGLRIRLESGREGPAGAIRLLCDDPLTFGGGATELVAPNGTRVELRSADPPLSLPPLQPSFVLTRLGETAAWGQGRAGMLYRDLIPDRQGGRFIASHIRILEGGPVPDYVHFHRIRFQMIYCYKGWFRVVYEDQGPPFIMEAGDAILQPPRIRHRVLECSPGAEVVEISCPAEHETLADPERELPTAALLPERDFGGQRFVRHQAKGAPWGPARLPGFEARDLGIAAATSGLAGGLVLRARGGSGPSLHRHDAELVFTFVLGGSATLRSTGEPPQRLSAGDSFVIPAGLEHGIAACSNDLELLEVTLPALYSPF